MVIRLVKKGQFWVGSRVVKRGQSRVVTRGRLKKGSFGWLFIR